jgi:protein-L-isoaspartate(D-aspartate) O-methyltransferase
MIRGLGQPSHAADQYRTACNALIREIASEVSLTRHYTGRSKLSHAVLDALRRVPRHRFVLPGDESLAYRNHPLRIGHGQTISQPYIVALMSDLLDILPEHRILEVGTGCGYQTAVLSELAATVCSVEIIEPLATAARLRLKELGYHNIHFRVGDGRLGCPDHAPFDGIMVTAAGDDPGEWLDQLKAPGRLIAPIGTAPGRQELVLLTKNTDGNVTKRSVLPVAFVPLTR